MVDDSIVARAVLTMIGDDRTGLLDSVVQNLKAYVNVLMHTEDTIDDKAAIVLSIEGSEEQMRLLENHAERFMQELHLDYLFTRTHSLVSDKKATLRHLFCHSPDFPGLLARLLPILSSANCTILSSRGERVGPKLANGKTEYAQVYAIAHSSERDWKQVEQGLDELKRDPRISLRCAAEVAQDHNTRITDLIMRGSYPTGC